MLSLVRHSRLPLLRTAALGALLGVALAAGVTSVVCVQEWTQNPGGIFRDESGTHWNIVRDLALSWFAPTADVSAPLGALAAPILGAVWHLRPVASPPAGHEGADDRP